MKHSARLALLACIFVLASQLAAAESSAGGSSPVKVDSKEQRAGSLDVILLLDKSLSMAPYFDEVKSYAAGNVLGTILIPGDRLIVEAVYGKTERLVTATIGSEEDKAKAIRTIRQVKANGRFTDLGTALDAAKRDLDELGQPGRPKYVLLLTDERQEAPKGSPYQAPDYKLKHPSLAYVKRVDLGKFRAITVGLQVADKVNAAAPGVMQLLMEPPLRGSSIPANAAAADAEGGSTAAERALPAWLMYGAGALLLVALAGFIVVLLLSKRGKDSEAKTEKK